MEKASPQSLGGQAQAKKSKKEALERYYSNPNYCLFCSKMIEVPEGKRVGEIKRKKFCNKSCAAKFNNRIFPKRKKVTKEKNYCVLNIDFLGYKTKGSLFEERKNWQSASSAIRRHARKKYSESGKDYRCKVCGYDIHIDICHIKSVSSFGDDALIKDINSADNLVALCKNHHWEFDNKIIDIDSLIRDGAVR